MRSILQGKNIPGRGKRKENNLSCWRNGNKAAWCNITSWMDGLGEDKIEEESGTAYVEPFR